MKVTSWNVNGIRARLERVLAFLDRRRPDALCLQETKVTDAEFPRAPFEERGYHVETHGQRAYNGVALIARTPLRDLARGLGEGPDHDRRLIAARIPGPAGGGGGLALVCVYVPNGQSLESPQFAEKLAWFASLEAFLARWADPGEALLVLGDFNVAPDDRDVHDPEAWRGQVHFHPREHAALAELQAWGLEDLFRRHEAGAGFYSWWDYRRLAFPKNRGLRIDLILATAAAAGRSTGVRIERDERKGKLPSDHAPVTAWLDEPVS
jgi:exodeoxyribonuclease-3